MSDRVDLYREFADRFHAGKKPRVATEASLAAIEANFRLSLPQAYRDFMTLHGPLYCPTLLDLIVDQKERLADVQQFLTPRQVNTETVGWGLVADQGTVAFASDCSGNLFAFRRLPETGPRPDEAAVWHLDHETGKAIKVSPNFGGWIARFLKLRSQTEKSKPAGSSSHQFQVVVQFPEAFFTSVDEIRAFGDKLEQSMPRTHDYDGFDVGSGTVNFFLFSNTPTAILANFRKYLGTNKVEKKVRIAYREVEGEVFFNLWPKRDQRPFDYHYD